MKLNPEFLEALDHFGTPRLDGVSPDAYVYVTRNKQGVQTPWSCQEVCRLAHELLGTEELNYLKLKVLKKGLKEWDCGLIYERIMGEPLK